MPESSAPCTPPCPVYERCGGCRTLHLSDAQRSARFTSRLRGALGRGAWPDGLPTPAVAMPSAIDALRTRITLGVHGDGSAAEAGLPGRERGMVTIDRCPVTSTLAMDVAHATLEGIRRHDSAGISAILVHAASDGARALVTIVSESSRVFRAQDIARDAIAVGATSVAINQRDADRRVLGRRSVPVAGSFPFVDEVDGIRVRVLATTPFEPNHWSARQVCEQVLRLAEPAGKRIIVVRMGNGLSSLALARARAEVTALDDRPEINHEARGSITDSGLDVKFAEGRNREAISALSGGRHDVVVIEAARSGTEPEQIAAIARLIAPPRIILIARSFEGLSRDLAAISEIGYAPRDVQAHAADPFAGDVTAIIRFDRPSSSGPLR